MNESIQSTTPRECVEVACELLRIFCKMGVRGVFATHLVDIAYKTVELNKARSEQSLQALLPTQMMKQESESIR
jgi:DNA mismatch repair protein MutS